jgi:hypothetical protein
VLEGFENDVKYGAAVVAENVVDGAEWLDPAAMALPESGGTLLPSKWLTEAQLLDYRRLDILPKEPVIDLPEACHKVRPKDEDAVQERLLQADMAVLMPEECIPDVCVPGFKVTKAVLGGGPRGPLVRGARVQRLVGGLFGISKKPGVLRVIFDRRP